MMGGRNADTDPEGRTWFAVFRQSLQELGWMEGRNFRPHAREAGGALIALPDGFTLNNRASLIALAAHYRLPAISEV